MLNKVIQGVFERSKLEVSNAVTSAVSLGIPWHKMASCLTNFCLKCRSMFSTLSGLQALLSNGYVHSEWAELEGYARAGCMLCGYVCSYYYDKENYHDPVCFYVETSGISRSPELNGPTTYPYEILNVRCVVCTWMADGESFLEFEVFRDLDDPAGDYLDCSVRSFDIGSDNCLENALRLLNECQDSHPDCYGRSIPLLPTRILDLGHPDEKCFPKLHISKVGEKSSYVALSYCWGGPQDITTTASTIETRMQGISLDKLPQSIQDAIKVARKLRIRYLWVDALCIIQDDTVDKTLEINGMGAIYKNATVTVAAANCDSVYKGFLTTRSTLEGAKLQMCLPNGTGHITLSPRISLPKFFDGGPLATRGWALQEFLLSPRVLLFGPGEVRWQCHTSNLESVIPSPIKYATALERLPKGVFNASVPHIDPYNFDQEKIWKSLIEDYSGRQLSLADDKLPAIAGIASELGMLWKDDYLAGLWRKCFLDNLVWYSEKPLLASRLNYKIPSWSWASIDGKVNFHDNFEPNSMEFVIDYVNSDAVSREVGPLTITTTVCEASELMGDSDRRCEQKMDDADEKVKADSLFAMMGCRVARNKEKQNMEYLLIGLILKPVAEGKYCRIGLFTTLLAQSTPETDDYSSWADMWEFKRTENVIII